MRFAIRPARLVVGRLLLLPMVVGHLLGAISASRGRQFATWVALRGQNAREICRRGEAYATTALPQTVRPPVLQRIAWHKSEGDDVVVVSAALSVYLRPWCEQQGLDLICTTLEEQHGRLTGRYVDGDCTGVEKVRRIRQRYDLDRYDEVYAYGDSREDREMLELADKKYYRGREISTWPEVVDDDHPPVHEASVDR